MKSLSSFLIVITLLLLSFTYTNAQKIQPGFNKAEYIELLKVSAKCFDRDGTSDLPLPEKFIMDYRSFEMGLENAWEMWHSADSIAVINIRPTINSPVSWATNVYAIMVPAAGSVKISNDKTFDYVLATHPKAAVHLGWLVCMAFLSEDILPKVNEYYNKGIKDFYVVGHSQGGGISYLLTSYFHQLKKQNQLPEDIQFKTYTSASPKPGNLYFAYDYENTTRSGWAYNVVNADDWVPECPFTVQTTDDFTEVNPFRMIEPMLKKQPFPKRMMMRMAYNNLDRPSKKLLKKYQKFIDKRIGKPIYKHLDELEIPDHHPSIHYVRAGQTIVLMGDEEYYKIFPLETENLLTHHRPKAYLYLAEKLED